MQLTLYTDYSIRVLLYLAAKPESPSTITEIADSFGISRNHLVKVVHNLATKDFIRTTRGKKGGIVLERAPESISLGQLVRQTEPDFRIVECMGDVPSTCPIEEVCGLKGVLTMARDAFLRTLDQFTLADITQNRALLRPILVRDLGAAPETADRARAKGMRASASDRRRKTTGSRAASGG
jgi:Rrf2 family nitric oxide-sensitive transcriptional repressor